MTEETLEELESLHKEVKALDARRLRLGRSIEFSLASIAEFELALKLLKSCKAKLKEAKIIVRLRAYHETVLSIQKSEEMLKTVKQELKTQGDSLAKCMSDLGVVENRRQVVEKELKRATRKKA